MTQNIVAATHVAIHARDRAREVSWAMKTAMTQRLKVTASKWPI